MSTDAHWDGVYQARPSDQLGWYQSAPATGPLVRHHSTPADAVIDVGAGDGRLVDQLLADGYQQVTALDLSTQALAQARTRLGPDAERVRWVEADVTTWEPTGTFQLWHDRAVFHFLTGPADRVAYVSVARRALGPGGRVVIATFSPDGPETCAGLPVVRYQVEDLVAEFAPHFEPVVTVDRLAPIDTDTGDQRPYVAAVLRLRPGP